jgi:hypothetical protein
LAESAELRERLQENLETAKGNVAHPQFAPIRALCETASKSAEQNPHSADQEAQRILYAAAGMLEELSAAGVSSSEMADVKDEVALVALHCAVLFGNKTER